MFFFSASCNASSKLSPSLSVAKVHPTSECAVDEGRKSQGNHGYHTRAAMEETSRQSAEAADDDDSTSEVHIALVWIDFYIFQFYYYCYMLT